MFSYEKRKRKEKKKKKIESNNYELMRQQKSQLWRQRWRRKRRKMKTLITTVFGTMFAISLASHSWTMQLDHRTPWTPKNWVETKELMINRLCIIWKKNFWEQGMRWQWKYKVEINRTRYWISNHTKVGEMESDGWYIINCTKLPMRMASTAKRGGNLCMWTSTKQRRKIHAYDTNFPDGENTFNSDTKEANYSEWVSSTFLLHMFHSTSEETLNIANRVVRQKGERDLWTTKQCYPTVVVEYANDEVHLGP